MSSNSKTDLIVKKVQTYSLHIFSFGNDIWCGSGLHYDIWYVAGNIWAAICKTVDTNTDYRVYLLSDRIFDLMIYVSHEIVLVNPCYRKDLSSESYNVFWLLRHRKIQHILSARIYKWFQRYRQPRTREPHGRLGRMIQFARGRWQIVSPCGCIHLMLNHQQPSVWWSRVNRYLCLSMTYLVMLFLQRPFASWFRMNRY